MKKNLGALVMRKLDVMHLSASKEATMFIKDHTDVNQTKRNEVINSADLKLGEKIPTKTLGTLLPEAEKELVWQTIWSGQFCL